MNNPDQIKLFLSAFTMQLPMFLVCLAASVIVLVRWKQAAQASIWALMGFASAAVLSILIPAVQAIIQQWVMQSGDVAQRASWFTSLAIVWSVLRAATYALLLVAVFAGRSNSARQEIS
jgi:hypothetical protein